MENKFVIDNSIVMAWCFSDESSKYADIVLDSLERQEALVPAIWLLVEVGNVVLAAKRCNVPLFNGQQRQ